MAIADHYSGDQQNFADHASMKAVFQEGQENEKRGKTNAGGNGEGESKKQDGSTGVGIKEAAFDGPPIIIHKSYLQDNFYLTPPMGLEPMTTGLKGQRSAF